MTEESDLGVLVNQRIRELENQGIRESGNQGIRESGNQGIGESGNQGIRELGNKGMIKYKCSKHVNKSRKNMKERIHFSFSVSTAA